MLFETPKLDGIELAVIDMVERLRKSLRYQVQEPKRWQGLLRRMAAARAIRGSNTIEGINVTMDDALAAVGGDEPLEATTENWRAVMGYQSAMTYVLQLSDDPYFKYSTDLIRGLHFMMIEYDLSKNPGRWRPGPIQVVDELRKEVVYRGPDAENVPALMEEFVRSLNQSDDSTPLVIRGLMSHLNLVMIHPFSDGNGRMARCVQTLVLARSGVLAAEFSSIEEYLGRNTIAYYEVLARVGSGSWNPQRDARPWLRFCLQAHYFQASTLLRRTRELHILWDSLELEIKRRGLPERTILAVGDAAMGLRVRNSTYRKVAEVSNQVASRDLKMLVDRGLLIPGGEKKGRYYRASPLILGIREKSRESKKIDDPFATPVNPTQLSLLET